MSKSGCSCELNSKEPRQVVFLLRKVLYITNYPSPYRVDFFNLLGKAVDLTVSFTSRPEAQKHRSADWFHTNYDSFTAVFLKEKRGKVFVDIIPLIREGWDHIIIGGYSLPTFMLAIEYMRLHRIPFAIEADGALLQPERKIKYFIKRHFIRSADAWFSSGRATTDYFLHYGAKKDRIVQYPFTSLRESDIEQARLLCAAEKKAVRAELGIAESKVVLAVGQFIGRKGFDILIAAAAKLPMDYGVYIVGSAPTEQYLRLKDALRADNVHFVGFKRKEELNRYYLSADVFAMPTREDIWGLVVNEALSFGLPVVSTDRCGAAIELVKDGVNGRIVPVDDVDMLTCALMETLSGDLQRMAEESKKIVRPYSIENMVGKHLDFFLLSE